MMFSGPQNVMTCRQARMLTFLHIKENPEKGAALLTNEQYRFGYLSPFLPAGTKAIERLTKRLASRAVATYMAAETTQELLVAPKGAGRHAGGATLPEHISSGDRGGGIAMNVFRSRRQGDRSTAGIRGRRGCAMDR